ncbi:MULTISPECIES: FeoA family protein [Thermotaleaceae]|uniref:Ferrous iron transport protein A n=1 Tax=Geosporobacter subterraneus DSM 17957 TaxID=1121919 RepID=A0A1M6HM77_9FIRM|nr:FeoA family protein [Geosporobacter subterraneus]SHJ23341.1 ferrous iron transport protein A [Geosporobacter subterraneus DSM 17957]
MINLTELKQGQKGFVAELNTNDENILRKLMSMGILPGMPLKVIQTFPSYVFQVGYTQVAVDKTIASAILVNM